jgi:hypothetical protein
MTFRLSDFVPLNDYKKSVILEKILLSFLSHNVESENPFGKIRSQKNSQTVDRNGGG